MEENRNNENKTALKFEIEDVPAQKEAPVAKTDGGTAKSDRTVGEVKEEFSVPDAPELDDAPAAVTQQNPMDTVPIRTTYVPRFTEVSDNFLMNRTTVSKERKPSYAEKPGSDEPAVDPTEELDREGEVEAVVVVNGSGAEDGYVDESMKVYKFTSADHEEKKEEPKEARDESGDDIFADLFATKTDEPEEIVQDTVPEPETQPMEEEQPKQIGSIFNSQSFKVNDEKRDAPDSVSGKKKKKGSKEYTSYAERDGFKDRFLDSLISLRIRLIAAILIALELLVLQCLDYFGVTLAALGQLGSSTALVDLLFSSAMLLLALPEIIRASAALGKRIFAPELTVAVSYCLLLTYTLIATLGGASYDRMSFGSFFSVQVIAVLIASLAKKKADFRSFKLATQNVIKSVVDEQYTRTLQRENMALDGAIDEYRSKIARSYRTPFVDGFFKQASVNRENTKNVLLILAIAFGIAAATGVVRGFFTDNAAPVASALETACMVFFLTVPTCSILVHKLPFKGLIDEAASDAATFIGEDNVYRAAEIDVITYEDTEVFGEEDVSVRKVHLYGKVYNTAKAMKEMYALFSAVGGPLSSVFAASLDRKCSAATDVVIEDDGVIGSFEGHRILAGSEEFMRRHRVSIPDDDYKTKSPATDSTRVMYGAEDGEVYVKFFFRYSFSEEFTMLLPEFKSKGIVPLIYTRDPNVTNEFLRMLTLGDDMIRVMKIYSACGEDKLHRRFEAGMVSLYEHPDTIGLALLARRYTSFQASLSIGELIAASVGGVASAVVGALFVSSLSGIPGFALAAWQLVLVGALAIASRLVFKVKKKKGN